MKHAYLLYSWLLLSFFAVRAEVMEIESLSMFPLKVYYTCPGQAERFVPISFEDSKKSIDGSCCINRIELAGYPDYKIESRGTVCTGSSSFDVIREIDSVFIHKAYTENNSALLQEMLLKWGLDPLKELSTTTQIVIEGDKLKVSGILAPTTRVRVAVAGNGMQRYKALLPAAIYDRKTDLVKLFLSKARVSPTQTFNGSTVLEIVNKNPEMAIILKNYFATQEQT